VVRRSVLLLAAGTLAAALAGCASNHLSGLANDLRNAEVGAPVDVTEQGGSVIVTSSPNAVHFAIRMAAVKSMRVIGCDMRGRSG
jgi:hypothetical protein